jgi:DNA polymerase III subunit delta
VAQIRLIKGDDPTLVGQALSATITELLGGGDRSLMVEEVTEEHYSAGGDPEIAPLVQAAHTPPFLTDKRIVIGRQLGLFTRGEQVAPLVALLADPLPTTDLVLVWEKGANSTRLGAIPKTLREALKSCGGVEIDGTPKNRSQMLDHRLSDAPIRFDASARTLIASHLGEDIGRVAPLIETLTSTFGVGAGLTATDVEPYLGEASDVPPWELTDAIDSGDIGLSLDKLHRMLGAGDRHPLQILATLHGHYQRILALDGAPVANEKDAAVILGLKGSTFPARKALTACRRLGSDRVHRIIVLLAESDLAVRGGSAMPPEALMDVLVARLARMSR